MEWTDNLSNIFISIDQEKIDKIHALAYKCRDMTLVNIVEKEYFNLISII